MKQQQSLEPSTNFDPKARRPENSEERLWELQLPAASEKIKSYFTETTVSILQKQNVFKETMLIFLELCYTDTCNNCISQYESGVVNVTASKSLKILKLQLCV